MLQTCGEFREANTSHQQKDDEAWKNIDNMTHSTVDLYK